MELQVARTAHAKALWLDVLGTFAVDKEGNMVRAQRRGKYGRWVGRGAGGHQG